MHVETFMLLQRAKLVGRKFHAMGYRKPDLDKYNEQAVYPGRAFQWYAIKRRERPVINQNA
jgi:hypothetical protein